VTPQDEAFLLTHVTGTVYGCRAALREIAIQLQERGVFDMASALETLDEALLKSAQSVALTGDNAEKAKAMSDAIQSIFQPLPQRAKTV
jgi:hypothetical protein